MLFIKWFCININFRVTSTITRIEHDVFCYNLVLNLQWQLNSCYILEEIWLKLNITMSRFSFVWILILVYWAFMRVRLNPESCVDSLRTVAAICRTIVLFKFLFCAFVLKILIFCVFYWVFIDSLLLVYNLYFNR